MPRLPVEIYEGKLILYGCGDLVNDYEGIGAHGLQRSDLGCLYFASLARQGGILRSLRVVPLQLRRFRLSRPDADARGWIAQQFEEAWRESGVSLRADGAGGWVLRG